MYSGVSLSGREGNNYFGGGVTVVATGGIARFVLPMCRRRIEYDRDLLLKGLSILYENNRREK